MKIRTKITRVAATFALAALAGGGAESLAYAQNHSATTTGSHAWSVGTVAYNKDTGADGDCTRTHWNSGSGSGGFNNASGYGATVSMNTSKDITAVQACKSRVALPMVCSSWNNDY